MLVIGVGSCELISKSGPVMDNNSVSELNPRHAIRWPSLVAVPPIRTNEVHVWAAWLDGDSSPHENLVSNPEQERAARFHFEHHRRRFINGRGILRLLLGHYLQVELAGVEFAYGGNGKPKLAERFGVSGLQFNLAHSEELALLAVSLGCSIGIDLEKILPLHEAGELVARFFSKRENAVFQKLTEDEQPEAFFNLWTRKEAFLKATGEGIANSLHLVEVSFLPAEKTRLISLPENLGQRADWHLYNLQPAEDFAAALAVPREGVEVKCWCLEEQRASEGPALQSGVAHKYRRQTAKVLTTAPPFGISGLGHGLSPGLRDSR
jgi:4'-phosphopantetheinyl transferase